MKNRLFVLGVLMVMIAGCFPYEGSNLAGKAGEGSTCLSQSGICILNTDNCVNYDYEYDENERPRTDVSPWSTYSCLNGGSPVLTPIYKGGASPIMRISSKIPQEQTTGNTVLNSPAFVAGENYKCCGSSSPIASPLQKPLTGEICGGALENLGCETSCVGANNVVTGANYCLDFDCGVGERCCQPTTVQQRRCFQPNDGNHCLWDGDCNGGYLHHCCTPGASTGICKDSTVACDATCGNSIIEIGEQCDDSNTNPNDTCTYPNCQNARCGDSIIRTGVEQCDDGNTNPNDACTYPTCQTARCGDTIVRTGVEQCDDGNTNTYDFCTYPLCKNARCGDGYCNYATGGEDCWNCRAECGRCGVGDWRYNVYLPNYGCETNCFDFDNHFGSDYWSIKEIQNNDPDDYIGVRINNPYNWGTIYTDRFEGAWDNWPFESRFDKTMSGYCSDREFLVSDTSTGGGCLWDGERWLGTFITWIYSNTTYTKNFDISKDDDIHFVIWKCGEGAFNPNNCVLMTRDYHNGPITTTWAKTITKGWNVILLGFGEDEGYEYLRITTNANLLKNDMRISYMDGYGASGSPSGMLALPPTNILEYESIQNIIKDLGTVPEANEDKILEGEVNSQAPNVDISTTVERSEPGKVTETAITEEELRYLCSMGAAEDCARFG